MWLGMGVRFWHVTAALMLRYTHHHTAAADSQGTLK